MSDLGDHFRPELVEALERFVDERIALALDPEPVVDDFEPVVEIEADPDPEPTVE